MESNSVESHIRQRMAELLKQKTERTQKIIVEDTVLRSLDGAIAELNELAKLMGLD